jgi:hypothetical protein
MNKQYTVDEKIEFFLNGIDSLAKQIVNSENHYEVIYCTRQIMFKAKRLESLISRQENTLVHKPQDK